ncbi:MAG: transcriptional repressor LexA [Deltaproteobacteria bacterium]|nr:transcriptional repressor LexA [Deltaproteobacteria bacterium]
MSKNLTDRQQEILHFIEEHIRLHGYSPSVRDIQHHFRLASPSGIQKHIEALVSKGYLSKEGLISRSLRPIQEGKPTPIFPYIDLPLAGFVAAGQPIEAIEQFDSISVPSFLASTTHAHYVLRVKGDSMIEDNVQDGDYVILDPRDTAANGEMVVALIHGGEATLKRYYHEGHRIRLQPKNPGMEPIYLREDEVKIQGVVVGIWRMYK